MIDAAPASPDGTTVHLGAPLRDAAVDPRPGDYLAPIGSGEHDPHGPHVIAAELRGHPNRRPQDRLTDDEAADALRARHPHLAHPEGA